MAEIRIDRAHNLGRSEAQRRLNELAPTLKDRYGVELDWEDDSHARLRGTGVSGTVVFDDGRLAVDLRLGLLLRPLAGRIRAALERQIDKALT